MATIDPLETMPVSPHARLLRWALRAWAAVILVFIYLPIVVLIVFSFEDSKTIGFPIRGLSTRWYEGIPDNDQLVGAIWTSIVIAVVVAVVSTLVGAMAAFPLVRARLRWPNAVRVLVTMPIMVPGVLLGVGLLVFLAGVLHIRLSLLTVVGGHLVLTMPFVVLIVSARLQGFDRGLEWAAADLGASPARTLRHVVLPLIAPAIAAGALISVTLSIDEFVVTFFTIGSQLTLPIYIYTQIKFGVTPEVNAVATLLLIATVATFAIGALAAAAFRRLGRLRRRTRSVAATTVVAREGGA
ncbi:MAG TPA: ABC transporter permease [Candidatus Limnocylindrales bacterium]|nr:ABC transporter permease [Candidatus Limnocylindrales bacterium]